MKGIYCLDLVTYRKVGNIIQIKSEVPIGIEELFIQGYKEEDDTYTFYTKTFSKKYMKTEGETRELLNKVLLHNAVEFNAEKQGFVVKQNLSVKEGYNRLQSALLQMYLIHSWMK